MTDAELQVIKQGIKRQARPAAYAGVTSVLAAVITMVICIVFTIHTGNDAERYARQQAQLMCALIITLDSAYQSSQPTTEIGKQLAENVHDLRMSLGC